ncbi:MAG: low temperature requirement protein A [Candidatus Limnocylindria bacterium]
MAAPARRTWRAAGPQSVTFVELFFDLVFVFAVTQITALTANHLTPDGVLRSVLLFWLIWWAWTQFTWTLNPADTTAHGVRVLTLVATGVAFVMATSVPRAFEDDALWFAVPYVVVRILGMWLQVRVDTEHAESDHAAIRRWVWMSSVGLVLVTAGAIADPGLRPALWLLAIGADLVAAAVAGRRATWDLNAAHLSERHGLIVIVALGESLIVAGAAIAGAERTRDLVAAVGASIVVASLLWWTYFGWLKDALEHACAKVGPTEIGPVARDAFSLAHFPLVCGIIGFAAAVEEIVLHPDEPAKAAVVAALGIGIALFVGASALAYWRLYRRVLVVRLAILVVMAGGLVVVAPLAPVWPLVVVAAALAAIVLAEARHATSAPAAGHPAPGVTSGP